MGKRSSADIGNEMQPLAEQCKPHGAVPRRRAAPHRVAIRPGLVGTISRCVGG